MKVIIFFIIINLSYIIFSEKMPVNEWSNRYRNFTYFKNYAIQPNPIGMDIINPILTDVPSVWEATEIQMKVDGLPKWRMLYTYFNGTGYQGALAVSKDLVNWDTSYGRVFTFNDVENTFDYGGVAIGGLIYSSPELKAKRTLLKIENKYWQLYGTYPHRNGYELRPGSEGIASSIDGLTWDRVSVNGSVLSVYGPDKVKSWEKDCIYQPYVVFYNNTFYNFYNAANGGEEQIGLSYLNFEDFPGVGENPMNSKWRRYENNPIIKLNHSSESYDSVMASDPKVYFDNEINAWVMFFFGGLKDGHADIMVAFSKDLLNWEQCDEPIYKAGGHPNGLDKQHAHKVSVVYDNERSVLVIYYCAVDQNGVRGITAVSSKPLENNLKYFD